jgi:hypothetical protein
MIDETRWKSQVMQDIALLHSGPYPSPPILLPCGGPESLP